MRPWVEPFIVVGKLRRVGIMLKFGVKDRIAHVRANRSHRMSNNAVETGNPNDVVLFKSLRILRKITN